MTEQQIEARLVGEVHHRGALERFCARWNERLPADLTVRRAAVYKCALAIVTMDEDVKAEARARLDALGMSYEIF